MLSGQSTICECELAENIDTCRKKGLRLLFASLCFTSLLSGKCFQPVVIDIFVINEVSDQVCFQLIILVLDAGAGFS